MKPEYRILELLKETPMLVSELQEKLHTQTADMISILAFLQKYELIEIKASTGDVKEMMAKITPRGLQLINLPDLPEEESSSNLLELMEKRYGGKIGVDLKTLCTPTQHAETTDWITDMAIRFGVKANDVIYAMWAIAKDSVWAKLGQDTKEKKRRKDRGVELGEIAFSEATINTIKTREDKRQQEIVEAAK